MATIKDKLSGYTPQQPFVSRKSVCVSENGKKYTLVINPPKLTAVYQIDGYIIREGQRCDKLILAQLGEEPTDTLRDASTWAEVFVELKGKDISHAIDQLESTLKTDVFKHDSVVSKRARIVGRGFPRSTGNSVMERAKKRFFKAYGCDLRGVNPGFSENL